MISIFQNFILIWQFKQLIINLLVYKIEFDEIKSDQRKMWRNLLQGHIRGQKNYEWFRKKVKWDQGNIYTKENFDQRRRDQMVYLKKFCVAYIQELCIISSRKNNYKKRKKVKVDFCNRYLLGVFFEMRTNALIKMPYFSSLIHQYNLNFIILENYKEISEEEKKYIIQAFAENDFCNNQKPNYSFKKMINTNSKIGKHFQVTQIFHLLTRIHNQNPLREFEGLKIHTSEYVIYLEEIAEQMGYKFREQDGELYFQQIQKQKKSLLLLFGAGVQHSPGDESMFNFMIKILRLKQSLGFIGGKKAEGYYFIGHDDNKNFIYLDPHYTQSSKSVFDSSNFRTYQCKSQFYVKYQELELSIGFGFYIENLDSLIDFYFSMKQMNCIFLPIEFKKVNYSKSENKFDSIKNQNMENQIKIGFQPLLFKQTKSLQERKVVQQQNFELLLKSSKNHNTNESDQDFEEIVQSESDQQFEKL